MKKNEFRNLYAYTDGSTRHNPGIGSYGAIFINEEDRIIHKYCKVLEHTTNNRAELSATIYAANWFKEKRRENERLVILTDSKYCSLGYTERVEKWKNRGWLTTNNTDVANKDLWEEILEIKNTIGDLVSFEWVKSHNGNKFNEMVDDLCRSAWKDHIK